MQRLRQRRRHRRSLRTSRKKHRTDARLAATIAAARKHGIFGPIAAVNIAHNMQQTLPWIVALVAVAVLAPAVVWFALRPRVPKATPLPAEWQVESRMLDADCLTGWLCAYWEGRYRRYW